MSYLFRCFSRCVCHSDVLPDLISSILCFFRYVGPSNVLIEPFLLYQMFFWICLMFFQNLFLYIQRFFGCFKCISRISSCTFNDFFGCFTYISRISSCTFNEFLDVPDVLQNLFPYIQGFSGCFRWISVSFPSRPMLFWMSSIYLWVWITAISNAFMDVLEFVFLLNHFFYGCQCKIFESVFLSSNSFLDVNSKSPNQFSFYSMFFLMSMAYFQGLVLLLHSMLFWKSLID